MSQWAKWIQQLKQSLLTITEYNAGYLRLSVEISFAEKFKLIEWLGNQQLFPQFYWCHRDGHEEIAACGAIKTFSHINQVSQFIQQINDESMRIWGLNAFTHSHTQDKDNRDCYFFLPRFELSIREQQAYLAVNLYSEKSLVEDAQFALNEVERLQTVINPLVMLSKVVSTTHQPEKMQWQEMISKALTEIDFKRFEKVVLARRSLLEMDKPLKPSELLLKSQEVNHNCYHFMLTFNEFHGFLGSTPERLFYRKGNQLETEALAGTVAGSDDDMEAMRLATWLMADQKNQSENLFVVTDIVESLKGAVLKLNIDEPKIVRLRKVQHLCRNIFGKLIQGNDVECIQRLQPTAAVAGLPRKQAIDFILENEPQSRDWYAGSAGYLSMNESELVVTLRSALVKENTVYLYAGAGIVTGSDPEHEWQEIENKAAGLRVLLQSIEL